MIAGGQSPGLRTVTSSAPPIVGRDEALGRITAFVAGAGTASGVLRVEGERGIGKTCLLPVAVPVSRSLRPPRSTPGRRGTGRPRRAH